jgi:hypothetical protein
MMESLMHYNSSRQLDQAALTLFPTGSDMCLLFQAVSSICGCPRKASSCNYCADGGPLAYPDKPVRFLKDAFGGMIPSCQVFEAFTHSLDSADATCLLIQTSSGFCGCAPIVENHCEICKGETEGLQSEYEQVEIDPFFLSLLGFDDGPFPVTCEFIFGMESQLEPTSNICENAVRRNDICGCNNGEFRMLGAKNSTDLQVLVILATIPAGLSLVGALSILLDVICDRKKRQKVYTQVRLKCARIPTTYRVNSYNMLYPCLLTTS